MIFFQVQQTQQIPTIAEAGEYEVVEAYATFAIAKNDKHSILIYGDYKQSQVVRVFDQFKPISSNSNFHTFDFAAWCKQKNVYESVQEEYISIEEDASGIIGYLYQKVGDDELLKSYIFQKNYVKEIYSSFQVTWFLALRYIFRKLKKKEYKGVVIVILGGALLANVGSTFSYLFFFEQTYRIYKDDDKDAIGFSLLLTLMFNTHALMELSYWIYVVLIGASKFIKLSTTKRLMLLVILQLLWNGNVDVMQLLMYPFVSFVAILSFVFAWLSLWIGGLVYPLFHLLSNLHLTLRSIEAVVYCNVHPLMYIWLIYLLFKVLHDSKDSYMVLLLLISVIASPYTNPFSSVYFLNVGQGDATLFIEPFGQSVTMIDAGGSTYRNIGTQVLIPTLKSLRISTIDHLIITHRDLDHTAYLSTVVNEVTVENIYTSKNIEDYDSSYGLHLKRPTIYNDENEDSIVTLLKAENFTYYMGGDSGIKTEKELMLLYPLLHVDILKLSHHGSKTSSYPLFVDQLHPRLAIASAGVDNLYGHPSKEVIEMLEKANIPVLSTNKNGAIRITSFFNFHFIETSTKEFGIMISR